MARSTFGDVARLFKLPVDLRLYSMRKHARDVGFGCARLPDLENFIPTSAAALIQR
jgi:hypothetical protein